MTARDVAVGILTLAVIGGGAGCYRLLGREEHERKEAIAKHTGMAEIHEAAGNYEGAADEYRAIIELAPDFAEAYLGLGNSLSRLGRYGEAAEAYRKGVTLAPDDYALRFNLGVTLARAEAYGEAASALEEAAALEPDRAEPYIYWGSALRSAGDYRGSAAALARALVLEPGNTFARLHLAMTLEFTDPARAVEEWRRVKEAPEALPEWRALAEERLAALLEAE